MRIRKRQNGKWQVEIRIHRQNISKTFADKKSCIQFGNSVEKQLRTFNTTKDMSTTVEQVIHKYIDDFSIHRKQSANEIRKWNKRIRDYPWLVRLSLAEITGEHFLRFREKRLKDGSRALNQDLSLFSVMFKKVINVYGFPLQNNPVAHIERAKENTYGRRRIITRREYKVFLESQEPYRLFFLLARNIGARPFSEITNFRWADFDNINNCLYVRSGKTNNATRTIPLTKYLVKQIEKNKNNNSEYIIPKSKIAIHKKFARLTNKYAIDDLQIYDFRRQFVRDLVERDMPIRKIARLTGHSWSSAFRLTELYSGEKHLRKFGH
jgi:integrase